MGRVKCDHIKRLITLTSDNIKRLSLYYKNYVTRLDNIYFIWLAPDLVLRSLNLVRDEKYIITSALHSLQFNLTFFAIWPSMTNL